MELESSWGSPTETGRWVPPTARLLQRPSFDKSKKALKVGLEVGKGATLVRLCSWRVCASGGRISNPGYPPSFKSYSNCPTSPCLFEACIRTAPGNGGSLVITEGDVSQDWGERSPRTEGEELRAEREGVREPKEGGTGAESVAPLAARPPRPRAHCPCRGRAAAAPRAAAPRRSPSRT